jgi:hypothetical protein
MTMRRAILLAAAVLLPLGLCIISTASGAPTIPAGSKVYVAPMGGFETYLKVALEKKKVQVQIVDKKEDAAYEISGVAASQRAGLAKKIIMGSWHSREEASIQVTNLKTGVVVFAYSYTNRNSAHGKRSSAEACAKHLKQNTGGE